MMKVSGLKDIHDVKPAGGIGQFSDTCVFSKNGRIYIGEATDFRISLLWGFGMRTAVLSGYLAARSIIEGEITMILRRRTLEII